MADLSKELQSCAEALPAELKRLEALVAAAVQARRRAEAADIETLTRLDYITASGALSASPQPAAREKQERRALCWI